jgi:DNA-binding IclR family transcriptional regulator
MQPETKRRSANAQGRQVLADKEDRYNIRVLDRAIRLLSVLSDGKPRSLTELSEDIGLNSSTTFRLLASLASYRYVERDEGSGKYRLGLACLELARVYLQENDVRRVALPELERLRDDTLETVHLALLNNMEVVYLEKLEGLHAVGIMSSRIGARAPSYCTGLGKALLAYGDGEAIASYFEQRGLWRYTDSTITGIDELAHELEMVRERGYSFDRGEHEPEVRCVAVPIFGGSGKAVAALSVSGPVGRMEPLETNRELIARAVEAAGAISARLGYRRRDLAAAHPDATSDVTA